MTALQDWLSFRPIDQGVIREMICRPLRAVLSTTVSEEPAEFRVMGPGAERC